jgi:site-specific recombinase XerD
MKIQPQPLFAGIENLTAEILPSVASYLEKLNIPEAKIEYKLCAKFLDSYSGSPDTFNSYRREAERFLHWAWLIAQKSVKKIDRTDIRHYIEFSRTPPKNWVSNQNAPRFIEKNGQLEPNLAWHPFVLRTSKASRKLAQYGENLGLQNLPDKLFHSPKKDNYKLSNKSLMALLAVSSTFFTFLQQEGYVDVNPVQLVRQKSHFIQKQQSYKITRKLSHIQWQYVIETVENSASKNHDFERHLFLMSIFYLLGLRISELSDTSRHTPSMGDFAPDKNGRWWFTTVGKGNKVRDIAVPDAMLDALKRYRTTILNLLPLPIRGENSPLIAKVRGVGNLGTRQIRNLVQTCFDMAIARLAQDGKSDEAQDLAAATVHWLRHTAISVDVEHRPREHVRDDAGHESSVITDHYIDIDRIARHESAKYKKLKPE